MCVADVLDFPWLSLLDKTPHSNDSNAVSVFLAGAFSNSWLPISNKFLTTWVCNPLKGGGVLEIWENWKNASAVLEL